MKSDPHFLLDGNEFCRGHAVKEAYRLYHKERIIDLEKVLSILFKEIEPTTKCCLCIDVVFEPQPRPGHSLMRTGFRR